MIRVLFNHVLPFVLGSLCGVAVFYLVTPSGVPAPQNLTGVSWGSGSGYSGSCKSRNLAKLAESDSFTPSAETKRFAITSKPQAAYTDAARQNDTEGSVLLKVSLLASGKVGQVSVVRGLPDGLTEQAVKAARQIEFEPKMVNGVPVSVTVTVEYTFEIY